MLPALRIRVDGLLCDRMNGRLVGKQLAEGVFVDKINTSVSQPHGKICRLIVSATAGDDEFRSCSRHVVDAGFRASRALKKSHVRSDHSQ